MSESGPEFTGIPSDVQGASLSGVQCCSEEGSDKGWGWGHVKSAQPLLPLPAACPGKFYFFEPHFFPK